MPCPNKNKILVPLNSPRNENPPRLQVVQEAEILTTSEDPESLTTTTKRSRPRKQGNRKRNKQRKKQNKKKKKKGKRGEGGGKGGGD